MSPVAPAWSPSSEQMQRSRLWRFMREHQCATYPQLCERAARDPDWFWDALIKELGIVWSAPYHAVMDTSSGLPFTRWFPGGLLNAYDSAVLRHRRSDPDSVALIGETEAGTVRQLTYAQLENAVEQTAAGLRAIGIERGVAVGLYLPLVIENAIALLACAKLGAVAVPLFSGFGVEAIRQRLADADARVLITADAAIRRGRTVPMQPLAAQAADGLPQLQRLVVVSCAGGGVSLRRDLDVPWEDVVRPDRGRVPTEAMASDEPLMLLYTSGTTGRPKGTVHGHAGLPIKSAQDWALGMDVHPGERVMWITDMGWVMGPLLVFGSLMLGGTAVFYDGAPDHPNPARVWAVAERQGVTHLGISPTLTRVLMAAGERAVPPSPISALRVLASTGEPWTPEAWTWLFKVVGRARVPIINYSGGTECGGGLVSGNVLTPSRPGSFAGPIPGIDAAVFNEQGQPVSGEVGELVVRQPYLGMTRNGKILRRVIRNVFVGDPPGDLSSIDDMASLDAIRALGGGKPAP